MTIEKTRKSLNIASPDPLDSLYLLEGDCASNTTRQSASQPYKVLYLITSFPPDDKSPIFRSVYTPDALGSDITTLQSTSSKSKISCECRFNYASIVAWFVT